MRSFHDTISEHGSGHLPSLSGDQAWLSMPGPELGMPAVQGTYRASTPAASATAKPCVTWIRSSFFFSILEAFMFFFFSPCSFLDDGNDRMIEWWRVFASNDAS